MHDRWAIWIGTERGYRWVEHENEMLNGRSPLEVMLDGDL